MKTVIVYYSLNGNTRYAAKEAAELINAELIEIKVLKPYPDKGAQKFLVGGKSAVFKETPALIPYSFDADAYDTVVIATPVWASNMTPPIRTFITENAAALKKKRIAIMVCCSGGGAGKAIARIASLIGIDAPVSSVILIDPKDRPSEKNRTLLEGFADPLK